MCYIAIVKYGCTSKGRYTNNLWFSQGKAKAGTQIIYDFQREHPGTQIIYDFHREHPGTQIFYD